MSGVERSSGEEGGLQFSASDGEGQQTSVFCQMGANTGRPLQGFARQLLLSKGQLSHA